MRIAIVNDQPLAMQMLRRTLARNPAHAIAWEARNGAEAVQQCAADPPDLILMDIFMPVMDGVEATRRIMRESPCAILIVTADISGSVAKVFEAMGAGALDAVSTPVLDETEGQASPLLDKIAMIQKLVKPRPPPPPPTAQQRRPAPLPDWLVAIGASTGGPAVLTTLLAGLPRDFPAAMVIIQHVDVQFAGELARWLDQSSRIPVGIARAGDRPMAGQAYVAATNDHLVLNERRQFAYQQEPADYPYRPSVNVFFDSLSRRWPRPGLAVLLTGMGRDGASGLLELHDAGWRTVAQDRDSCAVYGMPKAAWELGAAGKILTPAEILREIIATASRPPPGHGGKAHEHP